MNISSLTVSVTTNIWVFTYQWPNFPTFIVSALWSKNELNFGIQIFNPNSATLHFRQLKLGHGTNRFDDKKSWNGVAGETIKDYFNSSPASEVSITKNGSYWEISNTSLLNIIEKVHVLMKYHTEQKRRQL